MNSQVSRMKSLMANDYTSRVSIALEVEKSVASDHVANPYRDHSRLDILCDMDAQDSKAEQSTSEDGAVSDYDTTSGYANTYTETYCEQIHPRHSLRPAPEGSVIPYRKIWLGVSERRLPRNQIVGAFIAMMSGVPKGWACPAHQEFTAWDWRATCQVQLSEGERHYDPSGKNNKCLRPVTAGPGIRDKMSSLVHDVIVYTASRTSIREFKGRVLRFHPKCWYQQEGETPWFNYTNWIPTHESAKSRHIRLRRIGIKGPVWRKS